MLEELESIGPYQKIEIGVYDKNDTAFIGRLSWIDSRGVQIEVFGPDIITTLKLLNNELKKE